MRTRYVWPAVRPLAAFTTAALMVLAAAAGSASAQAPSVREQKTPAAAFMTSYTIGTRVERLDQFFLAWAEDRGSGSNIYGKLLFNNGLPKGGPERQGVEVIRQRTGGPGTTDPPGERADPDLVWNQATGELLMVYSEFMGDPDGWDIYAVRLSPNGYSRSNPRKIVGGPGDQQRPDVALLGADGRSTSDDYIVVYDDNTRDLDEIWATRLRSNSIPNGKPYMLYAGETWNATDPTTNGSVVAWVDDRGADTDLYAVRLRNGLPIGDDYRLAGTDDDDLSPNFGTGSLVWNTFDPATGTDIQGIQVYGNDRARGRTIGIVVPAANQSWPVIANDLLIWADDRVGNFDLWALRTVNVRRRGNEFPLIMDKGTVLPD